MCCAVCNVCVHVISTATLCSIMIVLNVLNLAFKISAKVLCLSVNFEIHILLFSLERECRPTEFSDQAHGTSSRTQVGDSDTLVSNAGISEQTWNSVN